MTKGSVVLYARVRSHPSGGSCDPVLSSFAFVVWKLRLKFLADTAVHIWPSQRKTNSSSDASINSRFEPRDNLFILGLPFSISSFPCAIFFRIAVAFLKTHLRNNDTPGCNVMNCYKLSVLPANLQNTRMAFLYHLLSRDHVSSWSIIKRDVSICADELRCSTARA